MKMRIFKIYLYGLLVLLFIVFVIQNFQTLTQGISLRFNLGFISLVSVPVPLFLVAAFLFFGGVVLTTLIHWAEKRPLVKEIKAFKKNASPSSPLSNPIASPQKEKTSTDASAATGRSNEKKSEGGTVVSARPLIRKDPPSGDKPSIPS